MNREERRAFAEDIQARIDRMRPGRSLEEIAKALTRDKVPTASGKIGKWTRTGVSRELARANRNRPTRTGPDGTVLPPLEVSPLEDKDGTVDIVITDKETRKKKMSWADVPTDEMVASAKAWFDSLTPEQVDLRRENEHNERNWDRTAAQGLAPLTWAEEALIEDVYRTGGAHRRFNGGRRRWLPNERLTERQREAKRLESLPFWPKEAWAAAAAEEPQQFPRILVTVPDQLVHPDRQPDS